MPRSKKIALASLVEDFAFYPRNHVDQTHVNDLVRALQGGATLPPIVAEAHSLRIVDGLHRRRALLRHFGEEASADVELRTYDTPAALFLDAVALNAQHGRKLDRHDQTRIVLMLREFKVDDQTIATTLHLPETQIETLSVRVFYGPAGEVHPSKRGLKHLEGQQMTDEQITVIESVRSAEAGRLCLELTRLLGAGLVDLSDEATTDRLRALQTAIEAALRAVAA